MNNSTEKNFIKHPLKLVSMVFVILLVLSFLPTETEIFGIQLKPVDVISDFSAEEESEDYYDEENVDTENEEEEPEVNEAGFSLIPGISKLGSWFNNELDKLASANSIPAQGKKVKISGNVNQMKHFFDALKKSKSQKVRIAHYGDSAIEGDNISCELRDRLQKKFGGKGLGFLAITSQDVSFRQTVTHSFSDTWKNASIFTSNPKKLPVGINGEIFSPKSKSWIQYITRNKYRRVKNFNTVNLYYSNAKGKVDYSFDKKGKTSVQLESGKGIKELQLKAPRKAKQIKIDFPQKDMGFFYGVSLENGNGVYLDNFPLRGNSGVNLYDIKSSTLKEFSKFLDYKLVVLYFGLNIAGNNKKANYTWYEKKMTKVINKFKKAFPECSFLVVSVSDKSIKKGRKFVTNPSIPRLVKTQRNIAKKTNVAFWNLFEAMGGKNSMNKWVKSSPKLASSDYTHFTLAGSKKVASLLAEALINCYEKNK